MKNSVTMPAWAMQLSTIALEQAIDGKEFLKGAFAQKVNNALRGKALSEASWDAVKADLCNLFLEEARLLDRHHPAKSDDPERSEMRVHIEMAIKFSSTGDVVNGFQSLSRANRFIYLNTDGAANLFWTMFFYFLRKYRRKEKNAEPLASADAVSVPVWALNFSLLIVELSVNNYKERKGYRPANINSLFCKSALTDPQWDMVKKSLCEKIVNEADGLSKKPVLYTFYGNSDDLKFYLDDARRLASRGKIVDAFKSLYNASRIVNCDQQFIPRMFGEWLVHDAAMVKDR